MTPYFVTGVIAHMSTSEMDFFRSRGYFPDEVADPPSALAALRSAPLIVGFDGFREFAEQVHGKRFSVAEVSAACRWAHVEHSKIGASHVFTAEQISAFIDAVEAATVKQ